MTVTYGFYDSLDGDRKYNAEQISRLFEGVFADGIFITVGNAMAVSANAGTMNINVGSGRCWFNHTWTLNDTTLVLTVANSEAVLNRIDTVVIEVNTDLGTRANSIKIIKGTPGSTPVAPTLTHTSTVNQYPLADIYVGAGVAQITAGNITNRIGVTDGTPYIAGVITPVLDTPTLFGQFETMFDAWFQNLQDQLDDNQAGNLQNQIDTINVSVPYILPPYKIVPTVATNHLTVALKHLDGTNPSASKPMKFVVGGVSYSLTAAMSFTKNAGTGYLGLGGAAFMTKEQDLFMYAIGETGAAAGLKFGLSRLPYGNAMADFSSDGTIYTGIIGNYTNFNAGDAVLCIGRLAATLSGTPNFYWSVPTYTNLNLIHHPITFTRVMAWTPQFTNLTVGNGTLIGWYQLNAKLITAGLSLVLGSTSSVTGGITFGLPMNRGEAFTGSLVLGLARMYNPSGGLSVLGECFAVNASTINVYATLASGTYVTPAATSGTVPFTWAATCELQWGPVTYSNF